MLTAREAAPMLGAALQGIPVDFGAMPIDDDLLPLIKMWHESERPNDEVQPGAPLLHSKPKAGEGF